MCCAAPTLVVTCGQCTVSVQSVHGQCTVHRHCTASVHGACAVAELRERRAQHASIVGVQPLCSQCTVSACAPLYHMRGDEEAVDWINVLRGIDELIGERRHRVQPGSMLVRRNALVITSVAFSIRSRSKGPTAIPISVGASSRLRESSIARSGVLVIRMRKPWTGQMLCAASASSSSWRAA